MLFGESFPLKLVPLLFHLPPAVIRKSHVLVVIIVRLEVIKVIRHSDVVGERELVVLKVITSELAVGLLVWLSNPAVVKIVVLIWMITREYVR